MTSVRSAGASIIVGTLMAATMVPGAASAAAPAQQWTLATTIPMGGTDNFPPGVTLAVDESTNTVYAASFAVPFGDPPAGGSSTVRVIDGATDAVTTTLDLGDPTLGIPDRFVVDPTTNLVYLPLQSGTVQVIDGADYSLGPAIVMPEGAQPWGAAVDPATQRLYVTDGASEDGESGAFYVIDAASQTVTTTVAPLDNTLDSPALDTVHGKMYVPVQAGDYVLVASISGPDENEVIGGIYGDDGDFDGPNDIVVDSSRSRGYVRSTAVVTTIDTIADAVVGEPLALGDPATQLLTGLALNSSSGTLFATRVTLGDQPQPVLLVVDVPTAAITGTVTVPADALYDVEVNSQTDTAYVAGILGSDSFVWVYRPATAPPPSPNPAVPPELPATGGDPLIGVAIAGAVLLVTGATLRGARRRVERSSN